MSQPLLGRRIAVIGNSGAGKSTLARALSTRIGVPHIELDALNWQPNWVALSVTDPERWTALVRNAVAGEAWVSDGNYSKGALPQILPRATDVVWLDYPRRVLMPRVIRRSFARALTGGELWPGTGNRESFRRWLSKEHPIRWTWDTYHPARAAREARIDSGEFDHARLHRFIHPRATDSWLKSLNA